MQTVELKNYPKLATLLKRVGYTKRKAYVHAGEEVECAYTYWDGGSKSDYALVEPNGYVVKKARTASPLSGLPPEKFYTKLGHVVVETGFFCGKPATASVTINPANMSDFGL